MKKFRIRAISKHLPGSPISHQEIERKAGIRAGWVVKNSGVESRHFASTKDSIASMSAKVLDCNLDKSNLSLHDLDLLICAGATYDYPIPYNACMVKKEMKAFDAQFHCFDVDATCLSFIVGMDVALCMMNSKNIKRVAITSAEISSRSLNPEDAKTLSLFGDAAVSMLIEEDPNGIEVLGSHFENHCEGAELAMVPAGGNKLLGFDSEAKQEDFYFHMQGKKLIKMTFENLAKFLERMEEATGVHLHEYDYIIPHQASKFGNEYFIKKYRVDPNKVFQGLTDYGNCISTSVALGLETLYNSGKIKKGHKVLVVGTAAGLSLGGIALQF
ncbi:MAG: 3-oxoacyl-[acyl-carrier-protein] synthase III C-terminal domain-containing protein [Bacteroidota bacterium]